MGFMPYRVQEIDYRLTHDCCKRCYCEGGRNALHLAAASGHKDVVAAILQARWDINLQDSSGCTALQRAAAEGHVEIVKQLIKCGANVNIQDKLHGNTALHEASWKGYSKCVEALCQATKINLQVKNAGGFTPLHLACQNGHNQSCRELLMANCDPDVQNNYGDTPLHTSARYGHAGVTRILISADCHMSDQNKNGDTALHIAAAMGRRKLTRILLEAGCDPNKRNKQNEKAKDLAVRKDLTEIVEIIDKTLPIKKKEKQKEKKSKEKEARDNDKKRWKESGSSKDSSTRPKEKKKPKNEHHQVRFEAPVEAKWSPYGCHYYPDSKSFPKPKLDSLPHEPLKKGEQYYLDLAGNIKKGPVGLGYTCYCAPFFRHMEERLDRDKKELKEHIDAAHVKLDKKVTNLEMKTRNQLNEITRSMALERAKCQQRHLHLEQWLIRGSLFRNTEKVRPPDSSVARMPKSKSLENVFEEKSNENRESFHRSVDVLNDSTDSKFKNFFGDGKESGKGSSEIEGVETTDDEDETNNQKFYDADKRERKLKRTTREMSERIDQIVNGTNNEDGMGIIYDEMLKWKSYRDATVTEDWMRESKANGNDKSQRPIRGKPDFNQIHPSDDLRKLENRRSYHEILEDGRKTERQEERRQRCLSDPQETDERQDVVGKLQKQHTVQELVAKIQRKTGLIHKSAQKWKENKLKNKEKNQNLMSSPLNEGKLENSSQKMPHNYENLRQWDVPQETLSQLPFRCRNTVYSPSLTGTPYEDDEYQRQFYKPSIPNGNENMSQKYLTDLGISDRVLQCVRAEDVEVGGRHSDRNLSGDDCGSAVDVGNELYGYAYSSGRMVYDNNEGMIALDPRKMSGMGEPSNYSPTQNDSGYSTKPYGGSSTGPSPSLSGQDFDNRSIESKPPTYLPVRLQKLLSGRTSSLV